MLSLHFWIILGEYCLFVCSHHGLLRSRCRDGEHSSSTSATLKRRIQALVLFASTALTLSEPDASTNGEGGSTTDIITCLLDLATPPTGDAAESDVATVVTAAQPAIDRIMNVISAREFLAASRVMLASEDTRVRFLVMVPLVNELALMILVLDQSGSTCCRFGSNSIGY